MSLAANGRGPPDVVVAVRASARLPKPDLTQSQFADGQSYSRTKLDEVARSGFFDPKAAAPKAKEVGHGKKEDVEYIVRLVLSLVLSCPRSRSRSRCARWK